MFPQQMNYLGWSNKINKDINKKLNRKKLSKLIKMQIKMTKTQQSYKK